ncbi:MAG TPA: c-type cytochrome biogenesis protein CcmI [Xanthobacteraceae bacterium]|jgi:cytochrome c-type biogenesis protein CcmH|nr:c-type cytochrome biogenesis protein CcmI [Xanthobacteraceae bacterium]
MILWILFALMTAMAILAVLWPLARGQAKHRSGSDLAVYRDQLAEIQRDRTAGQIGEAEAEAARIEVSRRLIGAADAASAAPAPLGSAIANWHRRVVAIIALVLLPLGAVGFYLKIGSPGLPGQPLSARAAEIQDHSIEHLVAQVEEHLAANPDDARGWEVIAPVYLRLGRYDDAVKARRNVLRLAGESAARQADLGEALVGAANGIVTVEAKAAFERAVALDPQDVKSRYFLGLAAEQDGRRDEAAATWRSMLATAPEGADWTGFVRGELARIEGGPGPADVAAASNMSPDQRTAMIRGMVQKLADQLHKDGSDLEGWLRLVRSYMVLGERDKALAAAGDARHALASDPEKLRRIDELVKGLGLEG